MPEGMSTNELYARCGWKHGNAYWKRRTENLKISVIFRLAAAVNAPLGLFVEQLAKELKLQKPAMPPPAKRRRGLDRVTDNEDLARALAEVTPSRHVSRGRSHV